MTFQEWFAEWVKNEPRGSTCECWAKAAWETAVATERERCAKIVDRWHIHKGGYSTLAEAIRSGGEGGRG